MKLACSAGRQALVLVALSILWPACRGALAPAELLFRNGAVYTVNPAEPWAQAVAVSSGRIVAVGSDEDVASWVGTDTRVVDLEGRMLLPSFGDSHVHPLNDRECNVSDIFTQEELLSAIRDCAAEGGPEDWIRGGGWALFLFPDANPHKSLLDELAPGRPVILTSAHGHSTWVSSRALEIAGITGDTPDPPDGRIERDPVSGEPTGTLHETASRLVYKHLPELTREQQVEALRRGLSMANAFGITSFQDASANRRSLEAYAALDAARELTARVVTSLRIDLDKELEEVPRVKALRDEFRGARFKATSVKLGLDGVIYNRTAALLEPYADRPGERWHPNIEPDPLNALVAALDAEEFQVHAHAVGDAAVRVALESFEYARNLNGPRDSRHHIAHIDLAHPDDFSRFSELEVIANFQPLWAQRDEMVVDLVEPRIGIERTRWVFPIGSILESGGRIAFGSDWTVSSMNPLEGLQVAVTRRGLTAGPGEAWYEEELVDLETAIAAYTIDVAYLNFQEGQSGSIEVGKLADLIVLDRNLFEIPRHEIHEAKVLLTLLEGDVVYHDASWSW